MDDIMVKVIYGLYGVLCAVAGSWFIKLAIFGED